MADSSPVSSTISERRSFPRIPGSALSWLRAGTARSGDVDVLDISETGVLIETPTRVKPGERELVLLKASTAIKVVGWTERVEITRLIPSVSYRTAIRFGKPVALHALGHDAGVAAGSRHESTPAESCLLTGASRELIERFTSWVRALSGVHAVRVASSFVQHPGTEPVHFAVPTSCYGERRVLQVFFSSGATPTAGQFADLRHLAVLASDVPDLDIVPPA